MIVWDCLSAEDIGKLFAYQMETHGTEMVDPHLPTKAVVVTGEVESTEEIERLMTQPRSRGE